MIGYAFKMWVGKEFHNGVVYFFLNERSRCMEQRLSLLLYLIMQPLFKRCLTL